MRIVAPSCMPQTPCARDSTAFLMHDNGQRLHEHMRYFFQIGPVPPTMCQGAIFIAPHGRAGHVSFNPRKGDVGIILGCLIRNSLQMYLHLK